MAAQYTLSWLLDDFDGRKFLDVSTGPAVQAAKRGFRFIRSDLSEVTISKARKIYANEGNVNFIWALDSFTIFVIWWLTVNFRIYDKDS